MEKDIASIIRARRGELGITQSELAKKAGVTRAAMCRYESGERVPTLDTAVRLSRALGINLDQLAGREPLVIGR